LCVWCHQGEKERFSGGGIDQDVEVIDEEEESQVSEVEEAVV